MGAVILLIGAFVVTELGWYGLDRAASPWNAVSSQRAQEQVQADSFTGTLKLATYNICSGRGSDKNRWPIHDEDAMKKRLDDIVNVLRAEAPDIVVLEEVDFDSICTGRQNQAAYIAQQAGYSYWVEQKNVDAETLLLFSMRTGNAVLSRYPITNAEHIPFPGHTKWETILGGKPGAVLCEIMLSDTQSIHVLATHLASKSEAIRVESVKIIEKLRLASAEPFFVVGDLNSTPNGFPCSRQAKGENALSLLLDGGGYTTVPLRDPTTNDFTISCAVIDWILVPPSWKIISRSVVPSVASDHSAVFMTVKVE